jgi:hypothetical protein
MLSCHRQDVLACATEPIDYLRPNVEVIKYVVPGAHACPSVMVAPLRGMLIAQLRAFPEKNIKADT